MKKLFGRNRDADDHRVPVGVGPGQVSAWSAYDRRVDELRAEAEARAPMDRYRIRQQPDGMFAVEVWRVQSGYDGAGMRMHYCKPPEPYLWAGYTALNSVTFANKDDAAGWLRRYLNPEAVSWGYDAKGEPVPLTDGGSFVLRGDSAPPEQPTSSPVAVTGGLQAASAASEHK